MLTSQEINPKHSLFYLGALILDIIKNQERIDFFAVYKQINKNHEVSLKLFVLTLDWLFLVGEITLNEEGELTKCS